MKMFATIASTQGAMGTANKAREFYRENPVLAAKDIFGISLSPHQVKGLMDLWNYPRPLLNWSRGMSKTFLIALYIVLRCFLYPRTKVGLISPSLRQEKEILEKISEIESIGMEKGRGAIAKFVKHISFGTNDAYISFTNGSKASCVPIGGSTKGKSSRGMRFHIVFVDEYAFLDESIINRVAKPFLSVKSRTPITYGKHEQNQLIVASSSWFKENHFYAMKKAYQEAIESGSDTHAVSEFNVLDFEPTSDYDLDWGSITEDMRTMPKLDFAMEYLNQFPSMTNPVIGQKTINRMFNSLNATKISCELCSDGSSEYVIAVDPAEVMGGDNFCFVVLKKILSSAGKPVFMVPVYCEAWNDGKSMKEAGSVLIDAFIAFRPSMIMIDTKGGGSELIKNLREGVDNGVDNICLVDYREKEHKDNEFPVIHPVVFSTEENGKMLSDALKMIERGRVRFARQIISSEDESMSRIYKQIKFLKTEIIKIKPKVGQGGSLWIQADTKRGKKDRVVAFIMACSAAYRRWFENIDDAGRQTSKKKARCVFGRIDMKEVMPQK